MLSGASDYSRLELSPPWSPIAVSAVHKVWTQAYECLAILESTSSMAKQALESNLKGKQDTHNLSAYFNKVRRVWLCSARWLC